MIKLISNKVTRTLGLITLTGLSGLMNAQSLNWSLAGPVYNAGRVRNIVIDKADVSGNTIYAGSTSSGVFKTRDGGANWYALNDQGRIKNISYMTQGADNTIYVATGEGFLRPGQMLKAQLGTGLYKLVPADSSLSLLTNLSADSTNVGHIITRIACSPLDASIIALATNKGVYISKNGQAFAPAAGIPVTANVKYGMDVKFDSNGILYCSVGNERSISPNPATPFTNVSGKVYRSTDNTLGSFTDITPVSSILPNSNYGRIEIAIAPSNSNVVYISCAKKSDNSTNAATLLGLFVTYNASQTQPDWTLALQGSAQLDPLTDGATIASGDYAHVLLVNPTNPTELFVGGYGFYIYFGGATPSVPGVWVPLGSSLLANTQYYLHENIHDIRLVSGNPNKFYFVTDAGIYRSTDLSTATTQTLPPSFQPFYKGLVTGQFNSVSIEAFPISTSSVSTVPTSTPNVVNTVTVAVPEVGFIGGTGGNGLNYFSGTPANVTQETNYLSGEVYNSEYSKILSEAAILSVSNGNLYRTTDARSSVPTLLSFNTYTGALSKIAPSSPVPFNVGTTTTGSPFRLWENYGQAAATGSNDPLVFYNDTLRVQSSIVGVSTLTSQKNFTFSVPRPNPGALLDSIVIRTATVSLPITSNANVATPFTNPQDAFIKLSNSYVPTSTLTIPAITSSIGPITAASVTLDAVSELDNISVTFSAAPFATYTVPFYPPTATGTDIVVADPAAYYRVFATAFYKYKAGDVVSVIDNNISTQTTSYSAVLTNSLSWEYGSTLTSYTIGASTLIAVSNPTYVLTTNGAINSLSLTQSTPVFTVQPITTRAHTITTYGTYSLTVPTVTYALTANTDTALGTAAGTIYSYTLTPGNVTATVAVPASTATSIPAVVFNVGTPTTTTSYTITQSSSSSTLTSMTYSTIDTPTYVLNPGNIVQSDPVFTLTIASGSSTTYTLQGLSSPPNFSTTSTYVLPVKTFSTLGNTSVPFAPNNPYVRLPTQYSAKLALAFSYPAVTGNNQYIVVVAKAPLSLNDPLNFVRLSQSGCLTTNPDGSPSSSLTINIDGDPTVLQWSYSGTELYYATSTNKLYRVSNINLILDYSPSSYAGKLHTDIFNYNSTVGAGGIGSITNGLNPNCPYRTTLIGTFTKRITSISISKEDDAMLLTFDENQTSSTPNLVQYCNANLKTGNSSNIVFASKTTPQLKTLDGNNPKMYCSMMEMHDAKKVFVGTDNGIFYTSDITSTSPTWINANNNLLPVVQVYDIKQQTMPGFLCYNSGQIYVATYGRGIWTNSDFRINDADFNAVAVREQQMKEKNISIFPNPSSGNVTVSFKGTDGESAVINVLDLSGRIVQTENLGKLTSDETDHVMQTSSLSQGIYLVNVMSSNGIKRTAKLIITK